MKDILRHLVDAYRLIGDKIWSNKVVALVIFVIALIIPLGFTVLAMLSGDRVFKTVKGLVKKEA